VEGVDDLDVLDVWVGIPGTAEIFHLVPETPIMLLCDGLEGLSSRWTLIRALEVPDEHVTLLVPGVDGSFGHVDEPRSGCAGQCRGQKVGLNLTVSSTTSMTV
jgi:hypothetical protein